MVKPLFGDLPDCIGGKRSSGFLKREKYYQLYKGHKTLPEVGVCPVGRGEKGPGANHGPDSEIEEEQKQGPPKRK